MNLLPKMSVPNLKRENVFLFKEFCRFNFLNLEPFGIADLTASAVLDAVPHRQL